MKEKIIIGVTGMQGSGKATIKQIAETMGYSTVVMGDEVREEAKRRNLEPTPENFGTLMLKLREEEGPVAIAKRCIPKIEKAKSNVVIVDGVRSLQEVEEFKKHFKDFVLIAVHASPMTRFQRLFQRERSDAPRSWHTFIERDLRELNVGLGSVIAMADYMIANEGTREQIRQKAREVLEDATRRWMK
jgi:dephospho-CoA kinase